MTAWPSTTIRSFFLRRFSSEGFFPELEIADSPIRAAFQMISALAFVVLGDVADVWQELKPTFPSDLKDCLKLEQGITEWKISKMLLKEVVQVTNMYPY